MKSGVHVTYRKTVRDGVESVSWQYHCCKDCDWYTSEGGWNQCDWRDTKGDSARCVNILAQIAALKQMIAAAQQELTELEKDL